MEVFTVGRSAIRGQHVDNAGCRTNPDLVAKAIVPDYALGNHTASLGLVFHRGELLPAPISRRRFYRPARLVESQAAGGYKVIFVPFADGRPSGPPVDVLTGFVDGDEKALGRPVGVAIDRTGALLVADDVGNTVWRVTPATAQAASR